jgi:hypothetical protein
MGTVSTVLRSFVLAAVMLCPAGGAVIYDFSMETASLIGHIAGPFSLEFQLNDGGGTGNSNNTVMLSNFMFGGGVATGLPQTFGGASGDVSSGVSMTDTMFFNQFVQQFMPGSRVGFRLELTGVPDPSGVPDQFSFAILDRSGTELPTLGPFDVFLLIDIDSALPMPSVYGGDPGRRPAAGGRPLSIPAPNVTVVPEPNTLLMLIGSLPAALLLRRRQLNRRASRVQSARCAGRR